MLNLHHTPGVITWVFTEDGERVLEVRLSCLSKPDAMYRLTFSQKERSSLPRKFKSHKESHALTSVLSLLPVPWNSVFVQVKGMLETFHLSVYHPHYKIAFCVYPRKKKGELQRALSPVIHSAEVWAVRSNGPTLNLWDMITSLCQLSPSSQALLWLFLQKWGNRYKRTLKWGRQYFSEMDLIETKWYYETLIISDTYVLNKYHLLSWIYCTDFYCDYSACQLLL